VRVWSTDQFGSGVAIGAAPPSAVGASLRTTLITGRSLRPDVTVIEVSTTVAVPPEEAYAFVLDFEGHDDYSEYVEDVVRRGDGGEGTRFDIELSWWKLSYTFPTQVTGLDEPTRIGWRTPNGLHATGDWLFEPVAPGRDGGANADERAGSADGDRDAPDGDRESPDGDREAADGGVEAARTRVTLRAEYDRSRSRLPSTPPLVSFDDVLRRLKPVVRREARRVFEHAVADLEGARRRVTLDVDVY
jgi:hypothetical protein